MLSNDDHLIQFGSKVNDGRNSVIIGDSAYYAASYFSSYNTILGNNAGKAMLNGNGNTILGESAAHMSIGGSYNTIIGHEAGKRQMAQHNTFMGGQSGAGTETGTFNAYVGTQSGNSNPTGSYNVSFGAFASSMKSGDNNIALGPYALKGNNGDGYKHGNNNIGIGYESGGNSIFSDSVGYNNIFIGTNTAGHNQSGDTLFNAVAIGANAFVGKSNAIVLGDSEAKIGIGNSYPVFDLDVLGTTSLGGAVRIRSGAVQPGYILMATSLFADVQWVDPSTLEFGIVETDPQVGSFGFNKVPRWNGTTLTDGVIQDNATNVGIGTEPGTNERLTVAGKTTTTNFQMTNGASNGFVLQTDASGNGAWVNSTSLAVTEADPQVSSAASNLIPRWNGTSLVDGVIQDDATNIGVGTAPVANQKLTVAGKTTTTNLQMTTGATNGFVLQTDASGNGTWVNSTSLAVTEADPQVSSTASNLIPRWNGTSLVDGVIQDDATNIGVGTAPVVNQKLTVAGKTTTTNLQMTNGASNGFVLQTDASGNGAWVNSTSLAVTEADPQVSSAASNLIPRWNGTTLVDGVLQDDATNIGVGTAPIVNQKLTVAGKTTTTNLQMTSGAGTNLVLQSDASGNASWVNPNTLNINNLYNTSGTLTAARTVTQGSNAFTILNNGAQNTTFNLSSTGDFDIQDNGVSALRVSDAGKVGINTSTPLAMLHVADSSVVFTGGVSISGTPGNPPVSGAGVRMMWYPDKAAFRAGLAEGTSWDKVNIGNYSFAAGAGTIASGNVSTATGTGTVASGVFTTAMGSGTVAQGGSSTAMGSGTIAQGGSSTAMGTQSIASGESSIAMGSHSIASGENSTATGN
ncbi:MAG: hypothetical protein IPL92_03580 [Saprospiraceae bacterium]|nr:hypothetical protein [Candidatus Opimibacter iunctus]